MSRKELLEWVEQMGSVAQTPGALVMLIGPEMAGKLSCEVGDLIAREARLLDACKNLLCGLDDYWKQTHGRSIVAEAGLVIDEANQWREA